jgi:hypothetical protein
MKTYFWKFFADYEKEEKWLNEMAAKGFALVEYTWCRYAFLECEPGEYIYRLELLEYLPSLPVSQKYIRFMEESGVEHIASHFRWVYFRRRASEGVFEIYSDINSKIKHHQRIIKTFGILAAASFVFFLTNLWRWLSEAALGFVWWTGIYAGGIHLLIAIMLTVVLVRPAFKKIKKLKRDRKIME